MNFCSHCGNPVKEGAKFCDACGAAFEAPVAEAPVYTPPVYAEPVVSGKTKAMGFVGMGLSIGGLFFAIIGLIYSLVGLGLPGLGFGFSIGFGIFSMPLSIIGRILSNKSIRGGFNSGAPRAGAGIGLAGLIISCVMLLIGIISLITI